MIGGCKSEEDETEVIPVSQETIDSNKLQSSIIDLPGSITRDLSSSGSMMNVVGKPNYNSGGSDDQSGIFSGVTNYVSMAEMFKDFIEELMVEIVLNGVLSLEQGIVHSISDGSNPEEPTGVKVEKPAGAAYEWKVSVYWGGSTTDADLIARFTLADAGAKGRVLWEMIEADENFPSVSVTRKMDLVFDGTSTTKSLEIKYVGDMTNYISYANTNWGSMDETAKGNLDLGQPEKVFLTASYNSTSQEYAIYATSYHPGWAVEATLNGENTFWGTGRSMYMFKVKAKEGSNPGAKLFLALPDEDKSDTTGVWTTDALGTIITDVILANLNTDLAKLADGVNDPDTSGPGGTDMTVAQEQETADLILAYLVYPPITSTKTYASGEYDTAKAYFNGHTDLHDLFYTYYTDVSSFNTWNSGLPLSGADPDQTDVFYWMMMAQTDARATTNGNHDVTKPELEAFADSNAVDGAEGFTEQYRSISYLINPAFFTETNGESTFLGTYDEGSDTYYEYSGNTLTEAANTTAIDALKTMDLSGIEAYVPSQVKSATITVE